MSRSLQCLSMLKMFLFMGVLWIPQTTAQLSLSTPTDGVQCYGDPVTLVCTHPVLPQRPEYLSGDVDWMRNNEGIPVGGLGLSEPNSTTTTLQFTTTEDTVGNYTCFLSNNVRGGIVESNSVPVRPLDQLPTPVNIATFSNSTTAVLTVSFDPQCCNTAQLNVDITTTSSSATTPVVLPVDSTDPTNTTIVITDITEGVCYTASIQSVCRDANSLLEDSGVLVVNFNGSSDGIVPNINGTDSTGPPPSPPATTPVWVWLAAIVIIVIVVIPIGVIIARIVVLLLRWKPNHGRYRIAAGEEKLVLLQVCDALNRHNTTIYSVLGKTVSLHSPPEESPHTHIWGEYKGRKFVANFVYDITEQDAITEQDVEELIQEKRNSRSDRGFLLCSKKTISPSLRSRLRQEDCSFVHVKNLPWKIGSREERTFVETFNSHFLLSESAVMGILARGGAHSSRDFEQLLFALFPFLNPNSSPESKVQTQRPSSPLSEQPHRRRPMYRRSTFINGVVSVLEILHVTILSVEGRCRRPQCQDPNTCTHMGEYRPDIYCQYKEKSFVVKCKVCHLDGAVTREDVEILSRIRKDVEAVCSCLVCDDLEMSEEVEKMLVPHNCLKAVVGLYSWNSMWVKKSIVALFQVLKLMNTPPAIPVKSACRPHHHSPQKESPV